MAYILYDWKVYSKRGYLYCDGTLENGKEWQTSFITSMYSTDCYYVIYTNNSEYHLVF